MHFWLLIVTLKWYLDKYPGHVGLRGKRPFPKAGEGHEIASNFNFNKETSATQSSAPSTLKTYNDNSFLRFTMLMKKCNFEQIYPSIQLAVQR